MFEEALKSGDCVAILCNCMKNLEEKMNELFQITSSAKDSQIKGKLQLKDLNEAVNFISTKFDEYEKERKEREQIIKNLEKISKKKYISRSSILTETVSWLMG